MKSIRALDSVCEQCLASIRYSSRRASTLSRHNQRRFNSHARILPPQTRKASSLSSEQESSQSTSQPPPPLRQPRVSAVYSEPPSGNKKLVLQRDNLFHSFTNSPLPEIRQRANFIKQHAFCPHPSHSKTRQPINPDDPEARKPNTGGLPPAHVRFECPDCGIPVACSEEHWADDYEAHLEICDTLREINEDDHDLRSGRVFTEFEFPGPQMDEAMINMTNWDTLLYTRDFNAVNNPQSMRQVTRMLTYPTTVASVLHELSPYNIRSGGRLTTEGLKSMSGKQIPSFNHPLPSHN